MKNPGIIVCIVALMIAACEREKIVTETETVYDTIYQPDTLFFYDTIYQTDTLLDTVIIIPDSAEVSFSQHIQPIWNQKCIACHNEFNAFNLKPCCSYEGIVPDRIDQDDPHNSQIYTIVASGEMPPGTDNDLTDVELAYLLEWIERGTPDN